MNQSLLVFIICSLLLLTSCGGSNSNTSKPATILQEDINDFLQNQQFECASIDGGPCPAGIARLFIINKQVPAESALCTGFLTAPDILITNNHCLESALQCESTYISVFNGTGGEPAKCAEILFSQSDGEDLDDKSIDVTVMRLDRPIASAVFTAATNEPEIGQNLKTWVIDHKSLLIGRITEFACELKSEYDSYELRRCPVIVGNSGSPLVNSRNELVGIIWGATARFLSESTPLTTRRAAHEFGYATKLEYFRNYVEASLP